jgi:predicted ester cyclase
VEQADKPFSDISQETSRLVEEGDTFVAEWIWRATNTAPLTMPDGSEITAAGKTVELPGVDIITVKDGKFAIQRDYVDMVGMMSQLGLLPST